MRSQDSTVARDRLAVTDTVSLVPAPDWNIDSGFRVVDHGADDSFPAIGLIYQHLGRDLMSAVGNAQEQLPRRR
ncbi:hypothetical protein [Rhodococcus wratislaviensis]|uniref:hypothetical protein n=1 Tax=Rhodococcus wratislaviensis TaxID=44752 RepID=UPI0035168479